MDNKSDIKRIPLSIPSEWKIIWNSFFGVSIEEAEQKEGSLNSYFTEDLLLIKSLDQNISIDLGWLPDMDLAGQYQLCIYKKEEEEPFLIFNSRSYTEITEKINDLLVMYKDEKKECRKEKLVPLRIPTGWEIKLNDWTKDLLKVRETYTSKQEATQPIFHAVKKFYGWIHITVQYVFESMPAFRLTIYREQDSSYYKSVDLIEEAEAIEIVEQWMEMAHLSNTELLFT